MYKCLIYKAVLVQYNFISFFTDSDYHFGIFQLFSLTDTHCKVYSIFEFSLHAMQIKVREY